MNTSTCKKIGAGVVTLIAGSVLSLAPDRADARTCLDAQGDGQCVVTPPTATSTPPHDCPIINGTSLCASDADLGLSGSGGTFVAGVYLPDTSCGEPADAGSASRTSSLATPAASWLVRSAANRIVTGASTIEVYIPDIVKGSRLTPARPTGSTASAKAASGHRGRRSSPARPRGRAEPDVMPLASAAKRSPGGPPAGSATPTRRRAAVTPKWPARAETVGRAAACVQRSRLATPAST